MDIYEYALAKERYAEGFYRQLSERTVNKGLKSIFSALADEEAKHYRVIEQMQRSGAGKVEGTVFSVPHKAFGQIGKNGNFTGIDAGEVEVYRQAQSIEKESRDFYLEKAGETQMEDEKKVFLMLAEEEKKHYALLDNIIEFVLRPQRWLENAEFYHQEEY